MNLQREQKEVKELQHHLNNDHKEREHFVNADVESEEDSEDEQQEIRVVAPKRKKKGRMDEMLMEQLLFQQKQTLKAQKKIYELQTEIDTEEVKTRYIKLDLNNAQVKTSEVKEELTKTKISLTEARLENWATRILIVLYIFWSIYVRLTGY